MTAGIGFNAGGNVRIHCNLHANINQKVYQNDKPGLLSLLLIKLCVWERNRERRDGGLCRVAGRARFAAMRQAPWTGG
jgi:hypothetical protein